MTETYYCRCGFKTNDIDEIEKHCLDANRREGAMEHLWADTPYGEDE